LPEAAEHGADEQQELTILEATKQQEQQEELQLLAAQTFWEMSQFKDFLNELCTTSVLNFLCIVLNQVPKAQEIVTQTFVNLSDDKRNLVVLTEGAMGDILETFFKTVSFQKPFNLEDKQALQLWRTGTIALSNTAQALATLIKYKHPCQVDMPTIIKVLQYSLAMQVDESRRNIMKIEPQIDVTGLPHMPDNVQLLAQLVQLFYWKCRTTLDMTDLMRASTPRELNLDGDSGLDFVLRVLVAMWKRCTTTHKLLEDVAAGNHIKDPKIMEEYTKFCVDDLDRSKSLATDSEDFKEKKRYADMRLCYLNCTLWVLLPIQNLRWKLKVFGLEDMHLAFTLTDEAYLLVILGTVRYLVDLPAAQESSELIMFFGKQLLILLDLTLNGQITSLKVINVLLDAISILAMGRDMQEMLAKYNIHNKLQELPKVLPQGDDEAMVDIMASTSKVELACLRSLAEVAIHPSHRLTWVSKDSADENDPFKKFIRDDFQQMLQDKLQNKQENADNFKTIASLLLTIFKEDKFKRPAADIESMFRSVCDWWLGNSTSRFDGGKAAVGAEGSTNVVRRPTISLPELLQAAMWRQEQHQAITVMESEKLCCPHECVIVLSLFSRLALEPKFKRMFVEHKVLDPLLGCVCSGIWAEAREAAATLANLMWLPDLNEEGLVCWLKFDGPRCIAVDASNVSMPIATGKPKGVDIGKGMYKSSWGVEFVEGSGVCLHPRGLKTHQVPGMLTTASPLHTFKNSSQKPFEWFRQPEDEPPTGEEERWFTISCWFYWPLTKADTHNRVLLHSSPSEDGQEYGKPLVYVEVHTEAKKQVSYKWNLMCKEMAKETSGMFSSGGGGLVWKEAPIRLTVPDLNAGWHMLSIVSSTAPGPEGSDRESGGNPDNPFNGTKFYIDEWQHDLLTDSWLPNDFHTVGNSPSHKHPFGLMTDFRIYSRPLKDEELKMMVRARDTELHPDRLCRMLAERNAASILAQRLDVPDSAAECLRALGSLATLDSQRAQIFSVCGRRVLQMIDSPLPMIQRQAARLINNIT